MEEDIELLNEEIDILRDEIYSNEKNINIIENLLKQLKKNYNLLKNEKEFKKNTLFKFIKKFLFKISIISSIFLILSFVLMTNLLIIEILTLVALIVYDTKNWLKETSEIRTLKKVTDLDKIIKNIQNNEQSLYDLNRELNYNKKQLKEVETKAKSLNDNVKNNKIVEYVPTDEKVFVLNRRK